MVSRCKVCGGRGWLQKSHSGSKTKLRPPFKEAAQAHIEWLPCYRCANTLFTAQPSGFGDHPMHDDQESLPETFTELAYEQDAEWREPS